MPDMQTASSGADISEDGFYRYSLWRTWDLSKPSCLFVMLNPSTADANRNDPTILRCIRYAEAWGFGELLVGNLFAYRATNKAVMKRQTNPVGPQNDETLRHLELVDKLPLALEREHDSALENKRLPCPQ